MSGGPPQRPPRRQHDAQPKKRSLKHQLRSVERLLKKVTETKARAALQAQQAKLLQAHSASALGRKEQKLATRYHKVKFFERKHIMKAQAKLRREIEAQGWANAAQRVALKQLDEDEEYVKHFPKAEKYVSLFAQGGDQAHAEAERARLRLLIKENIRAAALLAERDEGGAELGEAGAEALAAFAEEKDEFFGEGAAIFGDGDGGAAEEAEEEAVAAPPLPRQLRRLQPAAPRRAAAAAAPRPQPPPPAGGRGAKRAREGVPQAAAGGGGRRAPPPAAAAAAAPRTDFVASWDAKRARIANGGVAPPPPPAKPKMHVRFDGTAPPPPPPPGARKEAARKPPAAARKPPPPPPPKAPLRSRAEGGRKRRPKKK